MNRGKMLKLFRFSHEKTGVEKNRLYEQLIVLFLKLLNKLSKDSIIIRGRFC